MSARRLKSFLFVTALFLISLTAFAAEKDVCDYGGLGPNAPTRHLVISNISDVGVERYGSYTVCAGYFNLLRYNVSAGVAVTFQSAPAIPTQLGQSPIKAAAEVAPANDSAKNAAVIKAAAKGEKPPSAERTAAPPTIAEKWKALAEEFQKTHETNAQKDEKALQTDYQMTVDAMAKSNAVLNEHSEQIEPDLTALYALHKASDPSTVFKAYTVATWDASAIIEHNAALSQFADRYSALSTEPGYGGWIKDPDNQQADKFIRDKIAALKAYYVTLDPSGDKITKLLAAQKLVDTQKEHFAHVYSQTDSSRPTMADVARTIPVPCDQWFGRSKTAQVQFFIQDRLDTKATQPTTVKSLSIVCQSNLTVTSGVGFTLVGERTPSFEPVDTTGTQGLGYSTQASIKPVYAFHVNGSIYDFEGSGIGLHGQVGAAFSGTGPDTASLEYLFGGAFSFAHRSVFVSPSLHLARRTNYVDGFGPGTSNTLKGSLTSLPTQQNWKTGFALTISFPFIK